MSTTTEVGYLTDIKFRNAVKRALTGFRVLGKNDYGRFAVYIDGVFRDETLFEIRYAGGDWTPNHEKQLENQLRLERQLTLAGFELVEFESTRFSDKRIAYGWRKRALSN
jgi:hypothetical protein